LRLRLRIKIKDKSKKRKGGRRTCTEKHKEAQRNTEKYNLSQLTSRLYWLINPDLPPFRGEGGQKTREG
jgi:hypothetical protein